MLLPRIEQTLRDRVLVASGDRGLLAFSGGPDSLCLLHLLSRLRESWQLGLRALHIDHGLRPASAAEGERALAMARALGVPAEVRRLDLRLNRGQNLQETARLARRTLLVEEARRQGADWIALGHTALDRAETVLMRIIRGCGPAGLAGMAWRAGPLIRPLLGTSRVEIEAYLARHGLEPIRDPSNQSSRFLRNRVRQRVLPLLLEENPSLLLAIARLGETCHEEDEALEELAERSLQRAGAAAARSPREVAGPGGEVLLEIDLGELRDLPAGLLHRVLRRAFARANGSARRLERVHLLALARLTRESRGSAGLDLPGLRAERRYDRLLLLERAASVEIHPAPTRLDGPGRVVWLGDQGLEIARLEAAAPAPREALALLNADRVSFPLTVRAALPGDRIRVGEMQSRKVARLLLDAKIPRRERSRVPLLLAGDEVVVVVGVRCAFGLEPVPEAPRLLLRWCRPQAGPRNESPLASPG